MTLASQRSPELADLTDPQLTQVTIDTETVRKALLARLDAGEDVDQAIAACDALILSLDDELCARNLDYPRIPLNGLGKPVVAWAAHQRMKAWHAAMIASPSAATKAAYADACAAYHRECSIERAIAEHGEALIGCMVANDAKGNSDAEIERTLAGCVCGPMLVALAKEMRARGLLDGLPAPGN